MEPRLDPGHSALLERNLRRVQAQIDDCARAAGREPAEVELVAVTKTVGVATCARLLELGVRDLGENRVEPLARKHDALARATIPPRWHYIGHLQRNKARRVLQAASVVHSLDSLRLLEAVERICAEEGLQRSGYLQLKLWPEDSKGGADPSELEQLLDAAARCRWLAIEGFMAMAPLLEDEHAARSAAAEVFARCADLARVHSSRFPRGCRLSMGMSGDYDLAIAAGAHVVRVGSALYEGLPETRPSHEGPSDAAPSDPARDERHAPEGGADGRTTSRSEDEA
jgi:pyridoxal phosphate enzyme (YggS family)